MPKRNWRFDRVPHVVADFPSKSPRGGRAANRPGPDRRQFLESKARSFRSALGKPLGSTPPVAALEEAILHEFANLLKLTDDAETIGEVLRELAERLASPCRVEWLPAWIRPSDSIPEASCFRAGLGARALGCLVIRPRVGDHVNLSSLTRRRLNTLCTIAAAAIGHDGEPSRSTSSGNLNQEGVEGHAPGSPGDKTIHHIEMPELPPAAAAFATIENPEETLGAMAPVPRIHDATYLTAVLPFALGQARRHAETLSVLCIEVDRRAGIAELLGNDRAEHALQDAGKQIAAQIRSSDFVCRLDDGRLLAVLPRASLQDASKIARKLCDDVKRNSENLPEVGGVTVSIGVAEFPACAENVFALFDAADDALGEAKRRGRNQAHAAPARRPEDRLQSA